MAETREKVLKEVPILERIQKVRMKLQGTDMDEHVATVETWERKAKKALILISLTGHEGIQMIANRARSEIAEINLALTMPRNSEMPLDPQILAGETISRELLIAQRRLWEWFLGLFDEAAEDLQSINADLDVQESDEEPDNGQ